MTNKTHISGSFTCEIFILAGGLSERMGKDKTGVLLGGRTLLAHVRKMALQFGLPVRTVRKDVVLRCGPVGGIYTALKRSRCKRVLFLPCDMPFISPNFFLRLLAASTRRHTFALQDGRVGFPFVLHRAAALPIVMDQLAQSEFSLQALAKVLTAKTIRFKNPADSFNINTPADLASAKKMLIKTSLVAVKPKGSKWL